MIKALLVEDNTDFREALKEVLLSYFPDMSIEEASEGESALKIVQEHEPELVFMDIDLPGENGVALTNAIKKRAPETTVSVHRIRLARSEKSGQTTDSFAAQRR